MLSRIAGYRRAGLIGIALLLSLAAFLPPDIAPLTRAEGRPPPPLAGFSYSPKMARWARIDPVAGLRTLIWRVRPDVVRLPVYWDTAAPAPDQLDFGETDALLDVIAEYDRAHPDHPVRVVLVVGARNLGAPELYLPSWLSGRKPLDLPAKLRSAAYTRYLIDTLRRYSTNPLLYGWQLENEPLDSTNPDLGDIALPPEMVAREVALAHLLDPAHPVVITTFNSATADLDRHSQSRLAGPLLRRSPWRPAGHPRSALDLGDVLGLNAYVATPNTPLANVAVDQRIAWKRGTLQYWADEASARRKAVWVTEMQAAPWEGVGDFTPRDLQTSAELFRDTGITAVFLWGAEQWLGSPSWLDAATHAVATLGGSQVRFKRPGAADRGRQAGEP